MTNNQTLTPLEIANHFIVTSSDEGISHLKLQKLVYCAQGWWLAFKAQGKVKGNLLSELPQAWQHGPVYQSLYRILKISKIHQFPINIDPLGEKREDLPDVTKTLLDWVYRRYKNVNEISMSERTHREGTPWYQITNGGVNTDQKLEIPLDLIEAEFKTLLEGLQS